MSIKYYPEKMLKKIAPPAKIERMLKQNLSAKQAAFSFLDDADFIDKSQVKDVALKVAKQYKDRIDRIAEEEGRKAAKEEREGIAEDPALLIQRVQNDIVWQVKEEIKGTYEGEFYTWLPSDADEPDPEHQLNYGKEFQMGKGEMPGDRMGCRCGMEIHVPETKLKL